MSRARFDHAPILLTAGFLLPLIALSILWPHGLVRSPHRAISVSVLPHDDDGDGDENMEHWGDPRFGHEQRVQLVGMTALFAGTGLLASRRRTRQWREARGR